MLEPKLPTGLGYLWTHFVQLHRGRSGSGFGPNPLSWSDIHGYCCVVQTALAEWEVEAIRLLDEAFLVSLTEAQG